MRVHLNVIQGRGRPRAIVLEAPSIDAARQQAASLGLTVLGARTRGLDAFLRPRAGARRALDIPVFIEQLRDLLLAGLSVIEALDALERGAAGAALELMEQVHRQLMEGKTLSDAFAADPVFPPLLVALVRASELTSDLPETLSRFLEHERRTAEVRHRVISTSIYPLLVIGVGGLVLLFLLFYVMPRFARIFEGMTGELPWSARAMVAWSQLLHDHDAWWIGGGVAVLAGLAALVAAPAFRAAMLRRTLSWGPLRDRLKTYFLARWYRTIGMLVQGGIALPQALNLANDLLPLALRDAGQAVERGVREGLSPSAAHVRAGMATPVAEQLMLAGERTGDLGSVLSKVAHFHELEVSRDLERAMRALEPIVMVLIGLGVGVVVVLMYMPIFELASAIQ
jgi:general secretion pathway protein F